MNRQLLHYSQPTFLRSMILLCLFMSGIQMGFANLGDTYRVNPPVILSVPADTTINSICDLLPADTLEAIDMEDGMLMAIPTDMPDSASIDPCVGGLILRIWEVTDSDGMMDIDTQRITINPDMDPPVFMAADVADYVVSCDSSTLNSLFSQWRTQATLTFSSNIGNAEDCSGVNLDPGTFMMNIPDMLQTRCDTLIATFEFEDICGNVGTYVFSSQFIVFDTVAPVFNNLLPDTVAVTCDSLDIYLMGNPASVVTVNDCEPGLTPTYTQDTLLISTTCSDREFDVRRRWVVMDSCGHTTTATQILQVRDERAPSFTIPADITISCDDDALDLSLTGDVTDTLDQCGGNILLFFNDNIVDTPDGCDASYTIFRNWSARDVCGNQRSGQQKITVNDTEPPTFTLPRDTTVNCGLENDLMVTGEPFMLMDNCDTSLVATIAFEDVIPLSCINNYIIERNWSVVDDCGNETILTQAITVVDTIAPTITTPATDLVLNCVDDMDLATVFSDWVDQHAGAMASDLCTPTDSLQWIAYQSGTQIVPTMPTLLCPAPSDTIINQSVDFIVVDDCGNADTVTSSFIIIDNTAPILQSCQVDTTISTSSGQCNANFTLRPPFIKEECHTNVNIEDINSSGVITSDALPGQEGGTPVNPLVLTFSVANNLPINAASDATLNLSLLNADTEGPTEYFNVFGEDGTLLGRTGRSSVQCGDADTSLTVPAFLIDQWAVDGEISIRLEPNIPTTQPGSFAINAICSPQSSVNGNLVFTVRDFVSLNYSYKLDNGPITTVSPIAPVTVTLPLGESDITYYVMDCAGNSDSCTYTVTVEDIEPPVLDCPDDISVPLESGNCSAMVTLPLPDGVTDNCAIAASYLQTMPADTGSAYLTFYSDPNLNDFLPFEKTYTFNDVAANAFGTVMITLDVQGDFNTTGAFMNVIGDSGQTIGSTSIGLASCSNPGTVSFTVPADTFNVWATDGTVNFTLSPNPITIPPGVPGDGINACNPAAINADGDVDSISYAFLTLSYQEVTPFYFAEGATDIPYSQMVAPAIVPTFEFNVGETTVSYVTTDAIGNADTCTFQVNVVDDEPPVALCQATIVEINPSGLDVDTVSVAQFDDGSFDNCQIDTMYLAPNTFTCEQAGTTVMATLTVVDLVGNTSTCTKPIRIEAEAPQPDYSSGICGGDTLYLFANPPFAEGDVYTYRWFSPQGFLISTDENPIIPNVDGSDAGAYLLEIVGLTGCVAEEVVNVTITDLPLTPSVVTGLSICNDEDIILGSSVTLNNATYRWYEGLPPSGALVGTTNVPEFVIAGPHQQGTKRYYMTIEANGCLSAPSSAATITVTNRPIAVVEEDNITLCEGEPIQLTTFITGVDYMWSGPDGFESAAAFPTVIDEATNENAGVYSLIVSVNGCESEPDFTIVNVIPKPPTPILTVETGPVCEGETVILKTLPSGASTYQWTGPDFTPFTTGVNQLTLPDATDDIEGQWRVITTKFGCTSDSSNVVTVVVNDVPNAMVSANPSGVCERDELELFATPNLLGATYIWEGPNNYNSVAQNPVIDDVDNNNQGIYKVTITSAEGCTDTASVIVEVFESPEILAISNDAPACVYGPTDIILSSTIFPADNGSYTYEWTGLGFSSNNATAIIPNATAAQNGTYSLTVFNEEGCASLSANTMVNVKDAPVKPVTPTLNMSTQPPFCAGDEIILQIPPYAGTGVTYTWITPGGTETTSQENITVTNAIPDDSGDYEVYVTVNGCDSELSNALSLTVNAIPPAQAFSNSPVCEGEALQLLSNPLPGATYQWNGPINSSLANPVITPADPAIHAGTYTLAVTVNGCTSETTSTVVTINEAPVTPMITNGGPICIDAPAAVLPLTILSGSETPGATYTWFAESGPIGSTQSINFLLSDFTNYNDGAFDFFVEAMTPQGCFSDPSASTTVQLNTIPDENALAAVDNDFCLGEVVTLSALNPLQSMGMWSLIAGNGEGVEIENPSFANTNVTGLLGSNDYSFLWSLSNGACINFSSDTLDISIREPELADAGMDTLLCDGDPFLLNATIPQEGMGTWSQSAVQEDFDVFISSPTDPNTPIDGVGVRPGNTYVFTWTVESECGETTDEVFVTISDNAPQAGMDQLVCNDLAEAQLFAELPAESSSGRWSSPNTDLIFDNPLDEETSVSNLVTGDNILLWTLDDGFCGASSIDTVIINYQENPVAFDDEVVVAFVTEVEVNVLLNDDLPPNSFISIINGPNRGSARVIGDSTIAYLPDPDFIGTDILTYEVCSDACECADAQLAFIVGQDAECIAPNIITPNGDNVNDVFTVPCLIDQMAFPNSQVLIFNRWGDEVFRSSQPYQNNWDGTFNGEELPADTYFYVVTFGDGREPINGYLLIQR